MRLHPFGRDVLEVGGLMRIAVRLAAGAIVAAMILAGGGTAPAARAAVRTAPALRTRQPC
jgi:hypothetical protein